MRARSARKLGAACALALVLLAATVSDAFATHFRYGQIPWKVPNAAQKNAVQFRFEMAFRRTFFTPLPSVQPATQHDVGPFFIERISSTGTILQTLLNGTVDVVLTTTQVYPLDDYFIGVFTYTFTFPA